MNSSSLNLNVSSSLNYRDSPGTALAKNVIIVAALGITNSYVNGTMIHTFREHQIFYMNPRYILLIHLVVNDMIHLTTTISLFVFSYVFYKITASFCCFIVTFAVFTTLNTQLNLTLMAVECYVALCFPLRHAELCTNRQTYFLIGCIWVLGSTSVRHPGNRASLVILFHNILGQRHSIPTPYKYMKRGMFLTSFFLSLVWLTLFFTYFRIYFAAHSAEGHAERARNTIALHGFQLFLCMLTYVAPLAKRFLIFLFPKYNAHILFVWYILVQILPRFVSPVVYGLRDNTFKQYLRKHLLPTIVSANKIHL